jgi:hypothetical protein
MLSKTGGNYSATAEKLGHSIAIVAIISLHGKIG